MQYVHAALLLHSAGENVTEDKVNKILKAAGVKVDSTRVKSLISALEGVDIEEAISSAPMFAAAPAAAPAAASTGTSTEKPVEEEEEEEEGEDLGLTSLFG